MINITDNILETSQIDYFINLPTSKLYLNYEEITENKIKQLFPELKRSISFYREYPDIFVDEILRNPIKPFCFYPVQRIMMRVFARYRYVFATFNRGFSKSFIGILFQLVMCILYPRNNVFITAGTSEQGTKIADDKITELLDFFPKLADEIKYGTRGKPYESTRDSLKVTFKNNSTFELVGALQSNRGRRKQGGSTHSIEIIIFLVSTTTKFS